MTVTVALKSLLRHLRTASPHQLQVARLVALSQRHEANAANHAEPRINALLAGMRDTLTAALPHSVKADIDVDKLLVNPGFLAYLDQLRQALLDTHQVALQFGYQDITHEVGSIEASFSLTNPHVAAAVDDLGDQLGRIDLATLELVRAVIRRGIENGSTLEDMGQALHESGAFSEGRAKTIARTEAGLAYARGAAAAFRDLDVTHVLISDGEDFDEPCASVDGTIQTIEWYEANPKEHPNCTRAAAPAPDDS